MAASSGDADTAFELYQEALGYDPQAAVVWLNLGIIWHNWRNLVTAEACYRKALEIDPKYALAHFDIANLLDERGLSKEALEHYLEAIAIDPHYGDAYFNLATIYRQLREPEKELECYQHFLQFPGNPASIWGSIARREIQRLQKKDTRIVAKPFLVYEH